MPVPTRRTFRPTTPPHFSRRALLAWLSALPAALVAACSAPDSTGEAQRARHREDRLDPTPSPSAFPPNGTRPVGANTAATTTTDSGTASATPGGSGAASSTAAVPSDSTPGGVATATTGRRITLALDPFLAAGLRPQAEAMRDRLVTALSARVVEDIADADVVLGQATGADDDDAPGLSQTYAAVVSRRLLVRDVTWVDLQAAWNGGITDWTALGSPVPHSIVPVTLQGSAGRLDPTHGRGDHGSLDGLADYLHAERGGLAIVPVDSVDFRFRTLTIDGVTPFRVGEADYPLRVRVVARANPGTPDGVLAQVYAALGADQPAPTSGAVADAVSMTWVGDIIMARMVHVKMLEYSDWSAPFRSIYPELTGADLTIANLETSLSDSFETIIDPTTFTFKTDTAAIAGMQLAQLDIICRANNHSFNYGAQGMDDTSAVLDAAGMLHFGMGHTLEESRRAVVVERGGTTYAFLGYNGISDDWDAATPDSPGTAPLVDWMVVEDIRREVAAGHVVIPYFHWGTEYTYDPNDEQRYFAQVAIDSGAALVMGTHPHWVQAVETYAGKAIIYSLGNFVFDQEWSQETKEGMMAHIWMHGATVRGIDLAPVLIEDYHKPRLMDPAEQWRVLEYVWSASDALI